MTGIEYIREDLSRHPKCGHGPTLLFSRCINSKGDRRRFFACSACRDRKQCPFFMWENDKEKFPESKIQILEAESRKSIPNINHRKLYMRLHEIKQLPDCKRGYCFDCSTLFPVNGQANHEQHKFKLGIADNDLSFPSAFLKPLENDKKEAQYLFCKSATETIIDILQSLKLKNILCMGAPRIHEHIQIKCPNMSSLLLDIDRRYHSFYGPLDFVWYNMFNHYFFIDSSKHVFADFLQNKDNMAIIIDPPFGGRVEPIAQTIHTIQKCYQSANNTESVVLVFLFFPYFMEPQILNSLPNYQMCDYKVEYDNHVLFRNSSKGRKFGSPVRIFTNVSLSDVKLPESEGYRFCTICRRWVYKENRHCTICSSCTSKDGRTYCHCNKCNRCVKPTWRHCDICSRCTQPAHICETLPFTQVCFHCKEPGHKKHDCPKVQHEELKRKRKKKQSIMHYNFMK